MEKIINFLKSKNQTIASMESCTGGLFASELTNINDSSKVFKLGLITYSNEYKEYFGISKDTIKTYTVYSNEVANEMAKVICDLAKSDFGIGVTGQLGIKDFNNNNNKLNTVYISIYDKNNNKYYNYQIEAKGDNRLQRKYFIINYIKERLYEIFKQ
ncbi:MAG: CinA family protein [Clostridia bacterium]|nr:CinA family protein [Clostridia bacterium]